jgi:ATP-dependent protease ClpP protease subunit
MKTRLSFDDRATALQNIHDYGINYNRREIYLHRYIHEESDTEGECGVDYRMAVQFEKNLDFLNSQSKEPIVVHMHTNGGDYYDGMAM